MLYKVYQSAQEAPLERTSHPVRLCHDARSARQLYLLLPVSDPIIRTLGRPREHLALIWMNFTGFIKYANPFTIIPNSGSHVAFIGTRK